MKVVKLALLAGLALNLLGARARASSHLEDYVRIGLRNNFDLRQQRLSFEQSKSAAAEARGALLPSVSIESRYSHFDGNVLNIGDLINPVYGTLNQLTGTNSFPTNVNLTLPQRQETSLRLVQPLFQPQVFYNYRMKRNLSAAASEQLGAAQRDLIVNVKTSYLTYAKSVRVVELYDQTLKVLSENLRVSQKLVDNQKATLDVVYRAKAELSDVQQKKAEAELQRSGAARSFNFILGREPDEPIALDPDSILEGQVVPPLDSLLDLGSRNREEFGEIDFARRAASDGVKLGTSTFLPNVMVAVDYGFQGNDYRFSTRNDLTTVSLVMSWNLFRGGQDAARRRQSVLASQKLRVQKDELKRQIDIQIRQAYDAVQVARQSERTALDRWKAAQRSFDLVTRRYDEGMASQLEYLDARSTFTNAGINQILTKYDLASRYAQLERAAALVKLGDRSNAGSSEEN